MITFRGVTHHEAGVYEERSDAEGQNKGNRAFVKMGDRQLDHKIGSSHTLNRAPNQVDRAKDHVTL